MNNKTGLVISLILNALLAAAAVYLYGDNTRTKALYKNLETDYGEALDATATLEKANKQLQTQLTTMASENNGEDKEKLLAELARKDEEIAQLRNRNAEGRGPGRGPGRGRGRGGNMEERMERMRENDPERFERMQAERKRMEELMQKRTEFFADYDTSKLPADKAEIFERYQGLMASQQKIREDMMAGNNVDFREMMQNGREMMSLTSEVRDILIDQYASTLGKNSAKAAAEIKNIIDMTSMGGGFGGGPGFGGGLGGFGGMPPRPEN